MLFCLVAGKNHHPQYSYCDIHIPKPIVRLLTADTAPKRLGRSAISNALPRHVGHPAEGHAGVISGCRTFWVPDIGGGGILKSRFQIRGTFILEHNSLNSKP